MAHGLLNSGHLYDGVHYPSEYACDEWSFRIDSEEKKKGTKVVGSKKILKILRVFRPSGYGHHYVDTIYSCTVMDEAIMEQLMEFVSTDRVGKISLEFGIDLEFSRTKFGFKMDDGTIIKLYKNDYYEDLESFISSTKLL